MNEYLLTRETKTQDKDKRGTSSVVSDTLANLENIPNLDIWRVVLGWDLVPRLPELFHHVGHTIQIWNDKEKKTLTYGYSENDDEVGGKSWVEDSSSMLLQQQHNTVEAYYQHYGNYSLGYAGAPMGWSSKAYPWMPNALWSHSITKYIDHLELLHTKQQEQDEGADFEGEEKMDYWVTNFKSASDSIDDDDYWEPPDDYISDVNTNYFGGSPDVESNELPSVSNDEAGVLADAISLLWQFSVMTALRTCWNTGANLLPLNI